MLAMLACGGKTALAAFAEPAVFASEHGVLDILMIAKPRPIPSISFAPLGGGAAINPIGWVYEICRRPATGDRCPPGTGTVADYGGVRLALQQGDTLKVRLVNQLPRVDPAKLTHAPDPAGANGSEPRSFYVGCRAMTDEKRYGLSRPAASGPRSAPGSPAFRL